MKIDFATHDHFLKILNALNIHQLSIHQNLSFMHGSNNYNITKIFTELIKKPKRKYLRKFSKNMYTSKSFSLSNMKYCISVWGWIMGWIFANQRKGNWILLIFSKTVKSKSIVTENKVMYFWNDFIIFLILLLILISQNSKW